MPQPELVLVLVGALVLDVLPVTMRFLFPLLLATSLFGQDAIQPASLTAASLTIPPFSNTLPVALCAFGSFDQLGSPRFTGGICGIYPVIGSVGIYGTTVANIVPKRTTDPTTGRTFYALTSGVRQGFHKTVFSQGFFTGLLGGDVGPSFSQNDTPTGGVTVNLSSSFVATGVFRLTSTFSTLLAVRALYISSVGWNPVIEAGFILTLKR